MTGSIFDLTGPQFLLAFTAMAAGAVALAAIARYSLAQGGEADTMSPFGPYDLAFLNGGHRAAARTAAAKLIHTGHLRESGRRRVERGAELPSDAHELERAVHRLAASSRPRRGTRRALGLRAILALEAARDKLRARGLLVGGGRLIAWYAVPAALLVALLIIGAIKLKVGLDRDRPVGFLVVSMLVATAGGSFAIIYHRQPLRTRHGDRFIEQLRAEHAALGETASTHSEGMAARDVVLAASLFGAAALPALGWVDRMLAPPAAARSGSGSAHSCGSSCGSSCGGGGCGGGCGGCGG